jgi:hypothetical protein
MLIRVAGGTARTADNQTRDEQVVADGGQTLWRRKTPSDCSYRP